MAHGRGFVLSDRVTFILRSRPRRDQSYQTTYLPFRIGGSVRKNEKLCLDHQFPVIPADKLGSHCESRQSVDSSKVTKDTKVRQIFADSIVQKIEANRLVFPLFRCFPLINVERPNRQGRLEGCRPNPSTPVELSFTSWDEARTWETGL